MELCPGGELLSYIVKNESFSMPVAQFYTAELVNALEHIHMKGIVHRDLKPENVLLSASMHVKLVSLPLFSFLLIPQKQPNHTTQHHRLILGLRRT